MAQKLISRQKPGMAEPTQQDITLQDGSLYRNYDDKSFCLPRLFMNFSFENT